MDDVPKLSLLVLRSSDVNRAVAFYEAVGLRFQEEQHGSGPRHFAAEWGGLVLEIYPESEERPTEHSTRLGFVVGDFDITIRRLVAIQAQQQSIDSSARRRVFTDPDGRSVEVRGS